MVDGHRVKLTILWATLVVTLGAALLAALAIIGIVLAIALGGRASNLYAVGPLQRLSSEHPGGKAFVRNPELSEEFEILKASGVFEIVSADEASKVVQLHPRKVAPVCGSPLLLNWATNGLVPATVRISSTFSFILERDGVVSEEQFVLEAELRASPVQYLFKPFRKDTRTLGAILASEYARGQK